MTGPDWTRVSTSTGYKVVYFPDHPRAWSTGYVYIHVIVAEKKLGRYLKKGENVHHIDGNRLNNNPNNIEVLSKTAHHKKHAQEQIASFETQVCANCGTTFKRRSNQRKELKGTKEVFCSRNGFRPRRLMDKATAS